MTQGFDCPQDDTDRQLMQVFGDLTLKDLIQLLEGNFQGLTPCLPAIKLWLKEQMGDSHESGIYSFCLSVNRKEGSMSLQIERKTP
jgi:hypothetical protein